MDLLSRYRNITVLLLVLFAQLVLLGYQVKSNQDVRLIRIWAVTAVTPVAKVIENIRGATADSLSDYINLHNRADENKRLKAELGKMKLENQYLKSELQSADRAVALSAFQAHSPSKMVPARVIATGVGASPTAKMIFVDRGAGGGITRGMAVITPDGIVGKVIATYPTASQVLLITDPTFAAGVISQKHHVRGTVRGLGQAKCTVDYIQNEEQVDKDEWFYTSGDDGVFPKGLPVGYVNSSQAGSPNKQITLTPSGLQTGLEEVLVVLEGVHQAIPELAEAPVPTRVHIQTQPPAEAPAAATQNAPPEPAGLTEADKLRERYQKIGAAQGHTFGVGSLGTKAPDFNLSPEEVAAKAARIAAEAKAKAQQAAQGAPPAAGTTAAPAATEPAGAPVAAPAQPKPKPRPAQPAAAKPASEGNTQ